MNTSQNNTETNGSAKCNYRTVSSGVVPPVISSPVFGVANAPQPNRPESHINLRVSIAPGDAPLSDSELVFLALSEKKETLMKLMLQAFEMGNNANASSCYSQIESIEAIQQGLFEDAVKLVSNNYHVYLTETRPGYIAADIEQHTDMVTRGFVKTFRLPDPEARSSQ